MSGLSLHFLTNAFRISKNMNMFLGVRHESTWLDKLKFKTGVNLFRKYKSKMLVPSRPQRLLKDNLYHLWVFEKISTSC